MESWAAGHALWADRYDELHQELSGSYGDIEGAVDFLAALADQGRALELGVGTGRIALPLAARGVDVSGIDVSEDMLARLRSKPGAEAVTVVLGDMAEVPVEGSFSCVYVVFNTLFSLVTQEEQIRCFSNVSEHLAPEGAFVVEAFVPDPGRLAQPSRVNALDVAFDRVIVEVAKNDVAAQVISTQVIELRDGQQSMRPVRLRYAWPSELDLMARLAGLRLRERWADWRRTPFGPTSDVAISVYELADPTDR